MNILLLGNGGREHALALKMSSSPHCAKLFIAPGNAGTARCGTNADISVTDFESIKKFCVEKSIGMVVVGPEEPLVRGVVDAFRHDQSVAHIPVIGPSREGAQLEGSKAFAKQFMNRHGIPTAAYREFNESNYADGIPYLASHALPIVLKADGLAAGKGVVICQSHEEAIAEYEMMLRQHKFGAAGNKVVVEEFLDGIEMSVFVLTDGKDYVLLPEAKDYKRIGEGDKGPNTGGMGAVSPVPFADAHFMKKVTQRIIVPTVEGLGKDGLDYRGFIFIGLIKVNDEPMVIEYNCRLGDPETEVIIPRLKTDLVELFVAAAAGKLAGMKVEQDLRIACAVMAVSGGYPGDYQKHFAISGPLDTGMADCIVFQAGTKEKDGRVVTNGGRVLCVTSLADNIPAAVDRSVKTLEGIHFEGIYFRRDIGWEFR